MGKELGGKRTNVCGDSCEDDLAFACSSHGFSEFSIVPGVDFTVALNVGRIGGQLEDLLGKGTVGALLSAGGQNNWQIEEFGNCSVGDDVVSEFGRIIVPSLDH